MRNKIKVTIASLFLMTFVVVGGISSSLAWFDNRARLDLDSDVTGSAEGAYFAYGNGTSQKPYGINKPRHLYNLAWLNYRGYFEHDKDEDGKIDTVYFEIDPTISVLDGLDNGEPTCLPPIGTSSHPFFGHFDGHNKTIQNFAFSNNFSDYDQTPLNIDSTNFVQPQIVGFIGVIGNLSQSYTFDTNCCEFLNTTLKNITVSTVTTASLIGIAAGYVNGTINNVSVDNSALNVSNSTTTALSYTSNISDYSIIGYCTEGKKQSVTKVKKDLYDVNVADGELSFNATDEGTDTGWGGSIDMKSMYDRLQDIKSHSGTMTDQYTSYQKYLDGELVETEESDATFNKILQYKDEYGSYSFCKYDASDSTNRFTYLYGRKAFGYSDFSSGGSVVTDNYTTVECVTINDGNGNYFTNSGTTITNTTSASDATKFVYDDGLFYYFPDPDDIDTYYLLRGTSSGLSLAASSTSSSDPNSVTWNFDNGVLMNRDGYGIYYSSGWRCEQGTIIGYTICSNGYYLTNPSGSTLGSTQSASDATLWSKTNDNKYHHVSGGNDYYIHCSRGGSIFSRSYNVALNTSSTDTGDYHVLTSKTASNVLVLSCSYSGIFSDTNCYLRYSSGWGFNTSSAQEIEISAVASFSHSVSIGEASQAFKTSSSTTTTTESIYSYDTYFPLSATYNDTSEKYVTNDKNTGYVISGANYNSNTYYKSGDIRVSYYGISDLSASLNSSSTYDSSKLEIVTRTANSGGFVRISDEYNKNNNSVNSTMSSTYSTKTAVANLGFEKYTNSREALDGVLSDESKNIYGLHFIDAAITTSDYVVAPTATINGVDYDDYQLPRHCVDFNLKEKGFVNFFAGSYFSNNKSFFSLNEIIRDGDDNLSQVKHISKIYKNASNAYGNYIYEYVGGTYSSGDSRGDLLFDCAWIESPTIIDNAMYYFEIPVNAGEYALGSVSGKDGAYLMYLDIGANAMKLNRSIFYERFVDITYTFEYPVGVAFTNSSASVDASNSICVAIATGFHGEVTYVRNDDDEMTVDNTDNPAKAKVGYYSDVIQSLHDPNGGDLTLSLAATTTRTVETLRMQFIDYNINMGTYTVTIVTDVSVNGGAFVRDSVKQYNQDGTEIASNKRKVFDNEGNYVENDAGGEYADNLKIIPDGHTWDEYFSDDKILTLSIILPAGTTETETLKLNVAIDTTKTGGTFYTYGSYLFTYTVEGDTITITVVDYDTDKTIYIGTTQITGDDQEGNHQVIDISAPEPEEPGEGD